MDDFEKLLRIAKSWPDASCDIAKQKLPTSLRIQCLACQRNMQDEVCFEAIKSFLVDHPLSAFVRPVVWMVANAMNDEIKRCMNQ